MENYEFSCKNFGNGFIGLYRDTLNSQVNNTENNSGSTATR